MTILQLPPAFFLNNGVFTPAIGIVQASIPTVSQLTGFMCTQSCGLLFLWNHAEVTGVSSAILFSAGVNARDAVIANTRAKAGKTILKIFDFIIKVFKIKLLVTYSFLQVFGLIPDCSIVYRYSDICFFWTDAVMVGDCCGSLKRSPSW